MYFLLHTQEGPGTADSLANFLCNPKAGVSYHYVVDNARRVVDVVDTDDTSWSVLNANPYTINLCFAGSLSSWTRQQWLDNMGNAIEVAAWLAVQDCLKYGIPTVVNPPPYFRGASISDHKYVTQVLGIGSHTDVGSNFPWDVFIGHVKRFTTPEDDWLDMPDNAQMLREVWDKLCAYPEVPEIAGKWRSRARCRRSNNGVDDTVGMELYIDANVYDLLTAWSAVTVGDPRSVETIRLGAAGQLPANDPESVSWFKSVAAKIK